MNATDDKKNVSNSENKVCCLKCQINRIVLLTKSEYHPDSADDEYCTAIESLCSSVKTYSISPNQFEFINLPILAQCLSSRDDWFGIILTSKRCIDALLKVIEKQSDLSSLTFFTIGIATKNYLYEKLKLDSIGHHTGNSEDLAKFILDFYNKKKITKPLLYPCSRIRSDPLVTILSKHIQIKEIACYNTIQNKNLGDDFQQFKSFLSKHLQQTHCCSNEKLTLIIVFFSSSGVENLFDYLKKQLLEDYKIMENLLIRFVAFGKQTESKMKAYDLNVWFVASAPNSRSLANDLNKYLNA